MATIPVPDHTGDHQVVGSYYTSERPVTPPTPPQNLAVVGSAWGPNILPDRLITVHPSSVSYQDLWSDVDPSGLPARAIAAGTYIPPVTGAMKLGG